jgi:hypothetical protein
MYDFHHIIVVADTLNKIIARISEPMLDGEVSGIGVKCPTLAVRASNPNHIFIQLKLRTIEGIFIYIIPVVHAPCTGELIPCHWGWGVIS